MPSNPRKVKIAIIEDDIAIAQMYRTKFEAEGYQVETAGDGAAGLQLIADFHPDVVLLDLMMPTMDGIEMLKHLRQSSDNRHTKVIVLTNMGDQETAAKVADLSVTDFIVKADLTPKQVSSRIKELLDKDNK
jgi:DNA-binding response OmpR family regulator